MKLKNLLALASCTFCFINLTAVSSAQIKPNSSAKPQSRMTSNKQLSLEEQFHNHSNKPINLRSGSSNRSSSNNSTNSSTTLAGSAADSLLDAYNQSGEDYKIRKEQKQQQKREAAARLAAQRAEAARQRAIIAEQKRQAREVSLQRQAQIVAANKASGLSGTWKTTGEQDDETVDIYLILRTDGYLSARDEKRNSVTKFNYGATEWVSLNGMIVRGNNLDRRYSTSPKIVSRDSITWVSKDEFILKTISSENSELVGIERRFVRSELPKIAVRPNASRRRSNRDYRAEQLRNNATYGFIINHF